MMGCGDASAKKNLTDIFIGVSPVLGWVQRDVAVRDAVAILVQLNANGVVN
jgi:hypothetical protein